MQLYQIDNGSFTRYTATGQTAEEAVNAAYPGFGVRVKKITDKVFDVQRPSRFGGTQTTRVTVTKI